MNSELTPPQAVTWSDALLTAPVATANLFSGADYDEDKDGRRLTGQILRVFEVMQDQKWRTLGELATLSGAPESSASAQLRNLRKPQFGGHTVNRRRCGDPEQGLYEYQLIESGL